MKDHRRKRGDVAAGGGSWKGRSGGGGGSSFSCTLTVVFCCLLLSALTFSTFHLFGVSFRPVLSATLQEAPALNAISGVGGGGDLLSSSSHHHHPTPLYPRIHQAVSFPDQLVVYLNYHPQHSQFTSTATDPLLLRCSYFPSATSEPNLNLPPISIDGPDPPSHPHHIVRCPLPPRGFSVSLSTATTSAAAPPFLLPLFHLLRWDSLVYESLLDHHDNTTVVFAKGLNLRQGRLSDPSRYECVYGWDFARPKYLLSSPTLTAAQEIVRCRTPLSILRRNAELPTKSKSLPLAVVSIRIKGRGGGTGNGILPSASEPIPLPHSSIETKYKHTMCICSMVRNQARFLREWIAYHARIGVQRWFIYDNNSNDSLEDIVSSMDSAGYNVTRHVWPWLKTQEAGFAHCVIRAGVVCRWVGFIDVDEFLYLPPPPPSSSVGSVVLSLHDVLKNYSDGYPWVGELRSVCHSFGPSGRKTVPSEGVTLGYSCRMAAPERHKSIVRPEALSPALLNVVHHFQLKKGFTYVNMDRGVMVINHYKYQVWEVFKEKFYRRVATYVADWQDQENAGSKDRAPGLGTKAVEPADWPSRFCEVNDTGLRDWVLGTIADPDSGLLPWS